MAGISIEQLQLSVRAINALHRMGIYSVEELASTSVEDISQQRNIGVKTLDEIKSVMGNNSFAIGDIADKFPVGNDATVKFTTEQLSEMSRHSITELGLSTRPQNALQRGGYLTIDKVAQLSEVDFINIKQLGKTSVVEIEKSVDAWIRENIAFDGKALQSDIDPDLRKLLIEIAAELEPIAHLSWKQLFDCIKAAGLIGQISNNSHDDILKTVLQLPQIQNKVKAFWKSMSNQGIAAAGAAPVISNNLERSFSSDLLADASIAAGILIRCNDVLLVSRDTFLDACHKRCDPDDRASQMLQLRIEGKTLQDVGDAFGLTRERVRQITVNLIRKFPLLFEDYFSGPYKHFFLLKDEFCRAFPEITEEGYEYLSIRYKRGKTTLAKGSLAGYTGLWKDQLAEFLRKEEEQNDKQTVSKTEMVMRVLISNSDKSLTIDEFVDEYYRYIERRGYPVDRLKINLRTVGNYLRNAPGIVFDRDNKVRLCDANPHVVWKKIDFGQYKNSVISAELIFRDYQDVMDKLDIRDGYELFYIIKSSISMWDTKRFSICCRRVPVIVLGDASEEMQAVKLLKEISPVAYWDYYDAYEERFGVRKESAAGNPVIANAIGAYYVDGQYIIDVPAIDEMDAQPVLTALREQPLWFTEDIEKLFDRVCKFTTHDAINAAAFRRLGYTLHTAYAYDASYGTALNFFDEIVFSRDVINLSDLDRRIRNLQMFAIALDKKKKSLEYIETAPKILMALSKVKEVYGLTIDEIREIQSMTSIFHGIPFFNGRSIWNEVKDLPIIQKLQGNDWMLTCIMRQQELVASLPVGGGIILSLESTSLSLGQICEWIASLHGAMPINHLEREFNATFGTRVSASTLAEKLKTSGSWDKVVTDSMDEYIDSLVDAGISDMDADDLLQEEFF